MWKLERGETKPLFASPKTQTFVMKYILPPGWLLFGGFKGFPLWLHRSWVETETWMLFLIFFGAPFLVFLYIAGRIKQVEVMEERIGVGNFREHVAIEYGFVERAHQVFGISPPMISIVFRETALMPWQKILALTGGAGGLSGMFRESEMTRFISKKIDESPLGQYRVMQKNEPSKAVMVARSALTALGMVFLLLLVTGGLDVLINPIKG